jgi:ABC transport system ATP-binding/permease protein
LTRLTQELRSLEDEVVTTEGRWLELSEMLE